MVPDDILLKIERAQRHIDELEALVDAFMKPNPYKIIVKYNSDADQSILYAASNPLIPPEISIVAGDVIHGLYSSLDHLAHELVVANNGSPSTSTSFPISKHTPTSKDEKTRYERQVCGMRQEAIEIIESMNPHEGADNNLWTIHKLNNINKHRRLVLVGYATHLLGPDGNWTSNEAFENGAILGRVGGFLKNKHDVMLQGYIALNEPETGTIYHPLLRVLGGCINDVKRAVVMLDDYRGIRRIGNGLRGL